MFLDNFTSSYLYHFHVQYKASYNKKWYWASFLAHKNIILVPHQTKKQHRKGSGNKWKTDIGCVCARSPCLCCTRTPVTVFKAQE